MNRTKRCGSADKHENLKNTVRCLSPTLRYVTLRYGNCVAIIFPISKSANERSFHFKNCSTLLNKFSLQELLNAPKQVHFKNYNVELGFGKVNGNYNTYLPGIVNKSTTLLTTGGVK